MSHPAPTLEACQRAAQYSAHHRGVSLLIRHDGGTLFEDHPHGGDPNRAHDLASGTKSFAGLLALAGVADGLLRLEEPVAETIEEWRGHPRKSRITIRQLLQLVGGIEGGSKPGSVPDYEPALHAAAIAEPGAKFYYSNAPFQIFGELMRRKLRALVPDPLVYLQARLLDPLGIEVRRWRHGRDGYPSFASGAALTASAWAKVGELVRLAGSRGDRELIPQVLMTEVYRGTTENPAYGLTWWLNAALPPERRAYLRHQSLGLDDLAAEPAVPRDLIYAAGAAQQRLYVSRAQRLVIVRQAGGIAAALAEGERGGFSDAEFFRRLSP